MKQETRKCNIEKEIKRLKFISNNEKCDISEKCLISSMIKNLENQLEYYKKNRRNSARYLWQRPFGRCQGP